VNVVEYDPSRRADVADLMARVWGTRPDEEELAWFYERNPVRPASVLLGEEDERVVATVAIAFLRMSIGGEEVEVGMPLRVATDPAVRGRGIFRDLQAANEDRVRDLGVRLLLTVPNAASAPVFLTKLDWQPLPSLRVWARAHVLPRRGDRLARFAGVEDAPDGHDRVLRDTVWLNWRFAEAPQEYALLGDPGYAVVGRRGRIGVVAAVRDRAPAEAVGASTARVVIASPPPWERARYARAGFLPTQRTFTVLGKALDRSQRVPERPHFELGDLDFL
jgi:GNAT superfamily N-acetyltransferase